jgi:predicted lipoprotein
MKKRFIYAIALVMGVAMQMSLASCDDDKDKSSVRSTSASTAADSLDYAADNAENWGKYMQAVATYLNADATELYNDWNVSYDGGASYASNFKSAGQAGSSFENVAAATQQIIDGCIDIANEVGEAKIGDPVALFAAGKTTDALYAVESWYSWHSRVDYSNNIYSVRNAFYGTTNGTKSDKSLIKAIEAVDPATASNVDAKITAAIDAIKAIPQPFRNNINSNEAVEAQGACADLKAALESVDISTIAEATLQQVNENYVDNVVLPTYKKLAEANAALLAGVNAFVASPSNLAFENLATLWLDAREPWEMSEAFLFGPVADKGLDPNMDSWPLSQSDIVAIIKNGDFSALGWTGEYDEESSTIEAAQAIRGFHTLEFLIFKDGKARTVKD